MRIVRVYVLVTAMIKMRFSNACLVLDPKGSADEDKLNKLCDFLDTLDDFVYQPVTGITGRSTSFSPESGGQGTDEDTVVELD